MASTKDDFDLAEELDETGPELISTKTPSGAEVKVLSLEEKDHYESTSEKYLKDNHFVNVSDLQDLDRIVLMETMCYRWSLWILEEKDYLGDPVIPDQVRRNISEFSKEIRSIKQSLGMDKKTRDADKGASVADYIQNLKLRASEFGVMRDAQTIAAITLWKELEGMVGFYLRANDAERAEMKIEALDILDWIVKKLPEFNQIDADFQQNQKMWIREV